MLAPTIAVAQISNYGLKAGVQSTGAYSDPPMDGRVIGFSIYGFADWEISDSFFSTTDLGITQRGFSNSQIQTDETGQFIRKVEANTKVYYTSLVSYFNVRTTLAKVQPYLGAGPRLDLLVYKSLGEYKFSSISTEDQTANGLDDFVFGGSFVVGIRNVSISSVSLRIEAKYEVDVTDSFSETSRDYRNNALTVVVGVNL